MERRRKGVEDDLIQFYSEMEVDVTLEQVTATNRGVLDIDELIKFILVCANLFP